MARGLAMTISSRIGAVALGDLTFVALRLWVPYFLLFFSCRCLNLRLLMSILVALDLYFSTAIVAAEAVALRLVEQVLVALDHQHRREETRNNP